MPHKFADGWSSNNADTFTLGRGTHVQNLDNDLETGQLVSILTCPLDIPPYVSLAKRPVQDLRKNATTSYITVTS